MNVEQRQAAANPQTKPPDLGCESACRLLSSTTAIAIRIRGVRVTIVGVFRLSWRPTGRRWRYARCFPRTPARTSSSPRTWAARRARPVCWRSRVPPPPWTARSHRSGSARRPDRSSSSRYRTRKCRRAAGRTWCVSSPVCLNPRLVSPFSPCLKILFTK